MQPESLGLHTGDTQPNPVVRLERGVVLMGAAAYQHQQTKATNQPFWGGMVAAAVVVVVISAVLAGMLLALPPTTSRVGGQVLPTPTPSVPPSTPTATPLPALPTVTQSWGQNAVSQTLSTQLDATHLFQATAISPDGSLLLGTLSIAGQLTPEVGFVNVRSRHFQTLDPSGKFTFITPHCCQTDGRFILVTDVVVSGASCAACNVRYTVFDLWTSSLRVAAVGSSFGGITGAWLDHGRLLLQTGTSGIQSLDLTAPTLTPTAFIALNPSDPPPVSLVTFAWPDVIYSTQFATASTPPQFRLRDLAAGTDVPLTALAGQVPGGVPFSMVLSNDTLFFAYPQNDTLRISECDHVTSSAASLKALTTYPDSHGALLTANDRLLIFAGLYPFAWDRAEGHWVALANTASAADVVVALAGHFLAVMTASGAGAPQQITLYDTAALPTTGATMK